jgi:hypothetical protein
MGVAAARCPGRNLLNEEHAAWGKRQARKVERDQCPAWLDKGVELEKACSSCEETPLLNPATLGSGVV